MRKRWILAILLVLFGATTVAASRTRLGIAVLKSKRHFKPLPQDSRVWYAPGQREKAVFYAALLEEAIATVTNAQGREFAKPFRVYIPADQASFNAFTAAPTSGRASGTAFASDIFISPDRQMPDPTGLLAHELSHLHLFQHAGFGSRIDIPEWFAEGLAVKVSGMGAKDVTAANARAALAVGKALTPHTRGGFPRPRRARDHGLNHFLYYRQSQMFVTWLEERDPLVFGQFLHRLLDGASFRPAFETHFGETIQAVFDAFKTEMVAEHTGTNRPVPDDGP